MRSPPSAAVRRFGGVVGLSLAAKLAGRAIFLYLGLRWTGGA